MNKLKTFWYVFKNSTSNLPYYKDILKAPFLFSLKYLFSLVYVVLIIQALFLSIQAFSLLPQLPKALDTLETRLLEIYPEDLVITIKDGILSTNRKEPFYIDIPELKEVEDFDHLITVDTEASVEAYLDYKSFFLVTDQEIVYEDTNTVDTSGYETIEINSIAETETITKQNYDEFVSEISSMFPTFQRLAPYLLIIGTILIPLIIALFVTASHLLLLLFLSVVTWTIAFMFKLKISYLKAFQLGMHGITFPILLQLAINLTGNTFPMVFISGFIFWMVLVLSRMQEVKVE